jgi:hypothetical protein
MTRRQESLAPLDGGSGEELKGALAQAQAGMGG